MIQEEFKFYKPCKLLRPYIRYYWVFKSNRPLDAFTYPIGCPQIIFHKQAPLYIPELNVTQDKLTISGQVNFSSHLYADGNTEMIVVVFHPHAMSMFLNIPTSLFYNQEVSGYSLENKSLNELATRIFDCENNSICISYIEKWLVSQIADNLADTTYRIKRIDAAIQRIYITPQISVNELSSIACLSKKQFERLFHLFVGINPKEYTRIVRFQKALAQMQRSSGQRNQSGTNSIRQRLCRPVALYPGVQEVLRIYAHVFAESIKSLFRFVHQSRINVPFVLSGVKRFSYFCYLIH